MPDFTFLRDRQNGNWVISAPRRSKRTNMQKQAPFCPFCLGMEKEQKEAYRVGGQEGDSNWKILVIENKFPFTPYHEVIIHSPDHHKNFDELPFSQVELLLQTYRQRVQFHQAHGYVYLFHNRGRAAGESIPHPHTQLTVIPKGMLSSIPVMPKLDLLYAREHKIFTSPDQSKLLKRVVNRFRKQSAQSQQNGEISVLTDHFAVFCPATAAWPDEVWVAPRRNGTYFSAISEEELTDMAFVMTRLIQLFDLRYGHEFPFNFYIYPGNNWYLRFIPRIKILGGFELGTHTMVNTQDPSKTHAFLKEHFWAPDYEKINQLDQADYLKQV